jgi:hypothetical protein
MANKRKTRPYCKLCVPTHQFSSLSALRIHQRKVHADRWGKAPAPAEAETAAVPTAPTVTISKVIHGPRTTPAAPLTLNHFRADLHLQMALEGYRAERERLDSNIAQLEAMIKRERATPAAPAPTPAPKKKRTMSPEGKARIADAQRKRWAKQTDGAAAANA